MFVGHLPFSEILVAIVSELLLKYAEFTNLTLIHVKSQCR
jgi:hypothetical protein